MRQDAHLVVVEMAVSDDEEPAVKANAGAVSIWNPGAGKSDVLDRDGVAMDDPDTLVRARDVLDVGEPADASNDQAIGIGSRDDR